MRMNVWRNKVLTFIVLCVVALVANPVRAQACPYAMVGLGAQSQAPPPAPEQTQPAQLTPQQLQELVAPIALYPDALVAQILAAAAYPTQIVEADRFLQQNPNLQGQALGDAVNQQDWDPSVKALTQFPSVLANMDKDLSWTSELGDANVNQPQDVMDAIQFMRQQAQQAGNLKSTPQETVTNQGGTVVIQPVNPQVIYVPEYNPELVYGYPVPLWPGFHLWWGISTPFISFGIGFNIFPFFHFGWGWPAWGWHWGHGGGLFYHGGRYVYRTHTFYDRNAYFRGSYRGTAPFARGDRSMRGYGPPAGRSFAPAARAGTRSAAPLARAGARPATPSMRPGARPAASPTPAGTRTGAFGGITRGGDTRSFSSRGKASMSGGMRSGGRSGGAGKGGGGGRGRR